MIEMLFTVNIIILIIVLIFLYILFRKVTGSNKVMSSDSIRVLYDLFKNSKQELNTTRQEIQQNLQYSNKLTQDNFLKQNQNINERLDYAAQSIQKVNKELGKIHELSDSLKHFQEFLQSPKLRGNIGEEILKDLLSQYFAKDHYSLQYKFSNGSIVDAIIKTDNGYLPIDAKFPLENFRKALKAESDAKKDTYIKQFSKDVKKHIKDISKKYILPKEGTIDFALMYIPSETVYYEIIRSELGLNDFAASYNVFLVSPNSFYYFLKIIMIGLQGKKIEQETKKILQNIGAIQQTNKKFNENLGVLATHLNNAKNAFDRVNSEYSNLNNQINNINLLNK